jgi:Pyruvate/2-oxoacid:ferredoxin oxidoreductase delta subunit
VEGICFCCPDCCYYVTQKAPEPCDPGRFIETTAFDDCVACGACVEVCHFEVREVSGDELTVDRAGCVGCGLCADECPNECIEMVERPGL